MTIGINALPYEILSAILKEVSRLEACDDATFTYGLSQAPEPLQDVNIQRVVRGHVPADTQRWVAVEAIREVNRQWHDWAIEYALKDLYVTRWRGSERSVAPLLTWKKPLLIILLRWMQSRSLTDFQGRPSSIAVYRDPYHSLRQSLKLFTNNPALATCVRRIWFDGYYTPETIQLLFAILQYCTRLTYATLPWTALRYGSAECWSQLLRCGQGGGLESLELLAVDLKRSQTEKEGSHNDLRPLDSFQVGFNSLRRLKIKGQSNHMALTDADLVAISRTASNLKELHITGCSTLTMEGIAALAESSKSTLEVIEYSPLKNSHRPTSSQTPQTHTCERIHTWPRLRDISLTVPSLCPAIFDSDPNVQWTGEMQLRASTICNCWSKDSERAGLSRTLHAARALVEARRLAGVELAIEVTMGDWIFDPKAEMVHGNFALGKVLADGAWPVSEIRSGKGGDGFGEGDSKEGDWTAVAEGDFMEGWERGYVRL